MAKKSASKAKDAVRRKLIAFDEETWQALDVLARDQMKSWDELAAEAFRDFLKKHGRSDDLRTALKLSIKQPERNGNTRAKPARKGGRRS